MAASSAVVQAVTARTAPSFSTPPSAPSSSRCSWSASAASAPRPPHSPRATSPPKHPAHSPQRTTDTTRIERRPAAGDLPDEGTARTHLRSSAVPTGRLRRRPRPGRREDSRPHGRHALDDPLCRDSRHRNDDVCIDDQLHSSELLRLFFDALPCALVVTGVARRGNVAFVWMIVAGYNVIRGENGRPEVA